MQPVHSAFQDIFGILICHHSLYFPSSFVSPATMMSIPSVSSFKSGLSLLDLWIPFKTLMKAAKLSAQEKIYVGYNTKFSVRFRRFRYFLQPQVVHNPRVKNPCPKLLTKLLKNVNEQTLAVCCSEPSKVALFH